MLKDSPLKDSRNECTQGFQLHNIRSTYRTALTAHTCMYIGSVLEPHAKQHTSEDDQASYWKGGPTRILASRFHSGARPSTTNATEHLTNGFHLRKNVIRARWRESERAREGGTECRSDVKLVPEVYYGTRSGTMVK